MWIKTDETGRILASTDIEEYAIGMTLFDFPDDFDFVTQDDYRIVDGELVHDPRPLDPEIEISNLKTKLAETDYVVTKIAEYQVTQTAIPDEDADRYSAIILQRQEWRDRINELEASTEGGDA